MSDFESQVHAHLPALRRYARALAGRMGTADDLVQDTLERAYVKFHLWTPGSQLRPWLFSVMHNVFVNQTRRPPPPHLELDAAEHLAAPAASPDLALDLERALASLPDEQREVLLLVGLEGLAYQEVATVLGVPLGTVMSRLSRARARLTDWMQGKRPQPTRLQVIK